MAFCKVKCSFSGVPGELYYARNGYVNDYALSFNLPIRTEVTEIHFDWFNDHPSYLPETKVNFTRIYGFIRQALYTNHLYCTFCIFAYGAL